jgi:CRP-like cAMP-binding protein
MTALEKLAFAITSFAKMSEEEFKYSLPLWQERTFKKGEFYNERSHICKNLGFIIDGTFRSYIIEEKSGEEKNVFLYSSDQFVVSFKSFINQSPCDYHTQAMTDSTILYINIVDLLALYQQSHQWERFGRLLAQEAFNVAMDRSESFLFKTPEERYLDLIKHHPNIFNSVPLYHISSYLGIQGPSLSRIRKRLSGK